MHLRVRIAQYMASAITAACVVAGASCRETTSVRAVPSVPGALLRVSGDAQQGTAGQTLGAPLVVKVADSAGADMPHIQVAWLVVGGGRLSADTTFTDHDGLASVTLTLGTVAGPQSVAALVPGLTTVTFTAMAFAGPAAKLAFLVQPSVVVAGMTLTPTVQVAVQDAMGNTVAGATDSITLAITSGTGTAGAALGGTPSARVTNGAASYGDLSVDKTGRGYPLTATAAGLGSATSAPFNVISVAGSLAVSAGASYECLVTADSAALCWGPNVFGALGNASGASSSTPMAVSAALSFAGVSAGSSHTCGVTTGGAAYCWGDNRLGQLGNFWGGGDLCATYFLRGDPARYACKWTPVAVSGGLAFASVTVGTDYTCGVTTGGAAYCWGYNSYGGLGNGSTSVSPTPVAVSGGLTFAALSDRYEHTCGVTTGGAAYCWGFNAYGQLGNGSTTSSSTPAAVSGGLTFAAVSTGRFHACGVTPGGAAYCWGANDYGQLGIGSTTAQQCVSPDYPAAAVPCVTTPVAVAGSPTFAAVSAGYDHTCGLTNDGAAYCWGTNDRGQLGNGSANGPQQCLTGGQSHACSTTPVAVSGGLSFRAVSAGGYDTCGLTTGGAVYCWGGGSPTPVLVRP